MSKVEGAFSKASSDLFPVNGIIPSNLHGNKMKRGDVIFIGNDEVFKYVLTIDLDTGVSLYATHGTRLREPLQLSNPQDRMFQPHELMRGEGPEEDDIVCFRKFLIHETIVT